MSETHSNTSAKGTLRVLLMSSSTGGGHDMRANSFMQWFAKDAEGTETPRFSGERIQTLETAHGLYRFGVDLYNWIQRVAPWLHHVYFNYLEIASMHRNPNRILNRDAFQERIREVAPDIVISTHAHLNHGYFELIREALGRDKVKCVTYCGELYGRYGFCRHWVNPHADLFIGAVDETCQEAARLGMPAERNWCGGFMLNPKFYETRLTDEAKKQFIHDELQFDPDKFTLVLSTGANGANNHIHFLKALDSAELSMQVVALCGTNEEARRDIESWARAGKRSLRVRALPRTDRMSEIMQSVSAIVARPGTGTTSEAIIAGCPVIFNGLGGVMPQEHITMKFARTHGFANLIKSASALPEAVRPWLYESSRLEDVRGMMRACRPERTPEAIMDRLFSLVPSK